MSTLTNEINTVYGTDVVITDEYITIELTDGRSIATPISWFPRLFYATKEERSNWQFIGNGAGIHWPDIDEDISIENVLLGKRSVESQKSLKKWLDARNNKEAQS